MLNYRIVKNPRIWSPLTTFNRDADRFFDDFWGIQNTRSLQQDMEREWRPACDVEEATDHYLLTLEMAGVPKDEIKIETIGNELIISGERQHKTKNQEEGQWYSERYYGKFQRTFTLPQEVETGKVEANYQDGILRLYLPKAEATKPRQIKIGQGSAETGFFGKLLGQSPKKEEDTTPEKKSERVA